MRCDFIPFPVLETERLILRKMSTADANALFEIRSNPERADYNDLRLDDNLEDTLRYINNINRGIEKGKWINWLIVYKENNKVIGTINIWNLNFEKNIAEVGYELNPSYRRRGLMTEALKIILAFGFVEMELDKIEAWTNQNNLASIRLLESSGFKYEQKVVEPGVHSKKTFQTKIYGLSRG